MNMEKHTPGPWVFGEFRGDMVEIEPTNGGLPVARVYCKDSGERRANANARLITSAPELVDALQRAIAWAESLGMRDGNPFCPEVDAMRAAIAKIAKVEGGK